MIVSLQAQPPAGEPTRCPLPDAGAERAWESLSAMFAGDGDVMFELYNEPGVSATPAGWIQWRVGGEIIYPGGACQAVGMQRLINDIRAQAPQNIIIVPSLNGEQSLAGRLRVIDPAHRSDPQLAYGIHYPSLTRGITFWDRSFGTASASIPVIVTEWDANSTTGCVPNAPATAQVLLDYLASKRIGVVGFAFDLPGTIVADSTFAPTSYAGFACGVPGAGPGQILFGDFAAEAQAGDGTQPDPTPAWIVSAGLLGPAPARRPRHRRALLQHAPDVRDRSQRIRRWRCWGWARPCRPRASPTRPGWPPPSPRAACSPGPRRSSTPPALPARPRRPSSATPPITTRWPRRPPTPTACCSSPLPRRAW